MVAIDRAQRFGPSIAANDNDNNDPMDTSNVEFSRLRAPCSDPHLEDTLSGSDEEYTTDSNEEDGFDMLVIPQGTDDQSATKLLYAVENKNILAPDNEDGNQAKKQKISALQHKDPKDQPKKQPKKKSGMVMAVKNTDKFDYRLGYRDDLAPLSTVEDWFRDLTAKIKKLGFDKVVHHLNGRALKVATMCSGTESPILALRQISQNLSSQFMLNFELDHLFSGEIVPYKQAFIERNFQPPIIFCDITELSEPYAESTQPRTATTAYGGRAEVPGDVDILIAGFVCKDYSRLNNAPKKMEDRGESGSTFYAIKDYAREYEPKMIILENVVKVPWTQKKATKKDDRGLDLHFEDIGYASRHLILDTKDFYVPQTRQRGYLIAIHKLSFDGTEEELNEQLDLWEKDMQKLKRPASVPAESLLLKSDDPKLKFSQIEDFEQKKKATQWDKCKIGHQKYRSNINIGLDHPITNWSTGGSKQLPDYYKQFKGFTERVLDTVDIAHLRCIRRGFDDGFWNRILELSQNVYRVSDTTKTGIMPCLTPNGLPFSTVRGGSVTGLEALLFQALDKDTLDVANLSPGELRNLAGNAMTSTVVGAVTAAALNIFHKILDPGTGVKPNVARLLADLKKDNKLLKVESDPSNHHKLSVEEAIAWASVTCRLCYCEGRHEVTADPIQQCTVCRHTTCITCGKNPKHCYEPMDKHFISARKYPSEFANVIKECIPMLVRFDFNENLPEIVDLIRQMGENRPKGFTEMTWATTINAIRNAWSSEVHFREIIRAECWHIHFNSPLTEDFPGARLELVISDHRVEWLLYATVPSIEPLSSDRRKYLEKFPCARMLPIGNDITEGLWELYMPQLQNIRALFKSKGELVKSYDARVGLPSCSEARVWDKFSLVVLDSNSHKFERDIVGDYEHSSACGQAYCSLYVLMSTEQSKLPLFLIFDHEKSLRNPGKDSFIFTSDIRRLEYGEYRRSFGRLPPHWLPAGTANIIVLPEKSLMEREALISVDGHWVKCSDISMDLSNHLTVVYHKLQEVRLGLQHISCNSQQTVFVCVAELPHRINDRWIRNTWTELKKSSEVKFFKEFRWLLERGLVASGHRQKNANWQMTPGIKGLCSSCAPIAPKLMWAYTENNKQTPFEDPTDARDYEHSLKARPLPLTVRYHIDSADKIEINVGINPGTLLHRALGQLALTGNTDNIKVSWRLITDDNTTPKPQFKPLALLSSQNEEPAQQPLGIQKHIMRLDQLKNLAWIINQERGPKPFIEEAIVEERVTHINHRLEAKATREVLVAGGVLAHEVGFGKTLSILGLIYSQSSWDEHQAQIVVPGRISIKATVVFCPPHLVGQWQTEVEKFLPSTAASVLVIGTVQKFKALTILDLQASSIIIVNWKIVQNEAYTMLMAQFAGIVEPDARTSARALRSWYATALEKIGQNVEKLKSSPETFGDYLVDEFEKNKSSAQSTEAYIPSKRLTGAAYMNNVSNSSDGDEEPGKKRKRKRAPKAPVLKARANVFRFENAAMTLDHNKIKCPLFEMLSFSRVVIDEYTYLEGKDDWKQVLIVLESTRAWHKWLLSGTPPMGGFSDIKTMGKLIGVNLGINDYSLMKSDELNRELKDMTESEKFLLYENAPSPTWQERRHEHAQTFLNHFVRKDVADIDKIEVQERFSLVNQSPAPRAIYHELMQFLIDSNFDTGRRIGTDHHKAKLIHDALIQCQDAEEALILRAASTYHDLGDSNTSGHTSLCETITGFREGEYLKKKRELEEKYRLALQLQLVEEDTVGFFESFRISVSQNSLGDLETSHEVAQLIFQVSQEQIPTKDRPFDDGNMPPLRKVATIMGTLFHQLVNLKRSWRFFEAVRAIQSCPRNTGLECTNCGLQGLTVGELTLLSQCGHLSCNSCLPMEYEICMASRCSARNSHYHKISASDLLQGGNPDSAVGNGKISDIMKLINDQIPQDEKVLVFVQFPKLLKKVQAALSSSNIRFCDLDSGFGSSKVLAEFKRDVDDSESARVMLLNIGDASASGSNLAVANHVIFVAPYHTKGSNAQYIYEAATTQAVGRARRYGQQKTVHVYHFLVKGTADIDITELRNSKVVKLDEFGEAELVCADREQSKLGTSFYEHISRECE